MKFSANINSNTITGTKEYEDPERFLNTLRSIIKEDMSKGETTKITLTKIEDEDLNKLVDNQKQKDILELLDRKDEATEQEIIKETGYNKWPVYRQVRKLVSKNLIEVRKGKDKKNYYFR